MSKVNMEKVEQDVMNASGVLKFFHVANNFYFYPQMYLKDDLY